MEILLWICLFLPIFCIWNQVDGHSRKKHGPSLAERVQYLSEVNAKRSVLSFNGDEFRDFVMTSPRSYSVVVMFTALSAQRQCTICRSSHDEFQIVANSFRSSQIYSNRLFFALIDYDEGMDVFQMLRLNSAPVIMHFPAKGKPKQYDTMDIQRVGFDAEAISKWIAERTEIQIRVFRPPHYTGTLAIGMLFSLVTSFLYLRRDNLDFLYNKNIWGIAAVMFCLAMVSGQMWNHIRSPPFVLKNKDGGVEIFHGSSQAQFVVESYIVMVFNALIVLGIIFLTEAVSRKGGARKRRILASVGFSLVTIFFSLILSIFRSKAHGYPYRFLFK